jgi:hypothetical protein
VSRGISIREIDPSKLGPNSPLLELMRRKPRRDLEHEQQVLLFQWVFENEPKIPELRWLFAVPNWIGVRTAKQGARLKAEGRRVGVLDIWWPLRRGSWPGLVIEMKIAPNKPTKEQRDWIDHLREEGWSVEVAYSADEAKQSIIDYLGVA